VRYSGDTNCFRSHRPCRRNDPVSRVPHTYRFRLAAYIAVLMVFLTGVLVLTYRTSSELVLEQVEHNVSRIAQQLVGQIKIESKDLAERARMVRDNAGFQEYLFIAVSLDTDARALRDQFRRKFGWLQVDRTAVLDRHGRLLVGTGYRDLAEAVRRHELDKVDASGLFYHDSANGLEIVATAPVHYRSLRLGTVVLSRALNTGWMATVREMTGGELLQVRDGHITLSTRDGLKDQQFILDAERTTLDGEPYIVRRVAIDSGPAGQALYLALPLADLTEQLVVQRNLLLGLVIIGSVGILVIGFMMLRNFSTPLSRLVTVFQEVSVGRYPHLTAGRARDEIGYLTHHVAEMVASLREKQDEITRVQLQLERQASTDELTGCYNRRYLYDLYPRLRAEILRSERQLSVLLIDLDLFKQINDAHGHLVGDEVLRHFSHILRGCCRVSDFIVRLGGEEFLVLTAVDSDGARVLAEKIRAGVEGSPLQHEGTSLGVTVSIGVAEAGQDDGVDSLGSLLSRADRALYRAKQTGRNRVVFFAEHKRRSA